MEFFRPNDVVLNVSILSSLFLLQIVAKFKLTFENGKIYTFIVTFYMGVFSVKLFYIFLKGFGNLPVFVLHVL